MSTIYTPNLKLGQPAISDAGWGATLNTDLSALDALAPIGALAVTLHEVPSTSLNVTVAAGSYVQQDGTIGTYAGASSQAVTTAMTNYIYLDLTARGSLIVNTTGFPTTADVPPGARSRWHHDDHEHCRPAHGVSGDRFDPRRD